MQALGVGEAPLMTGGEQDQAEGHVTPPLGAEVLDDVTDRAAEFAVARGAENVGTTDILFAVFDVYGKLFDRVLYMRGTSRDELIERLTAAAARQLAAVAPRLLQATPEVEEVVGA